MYLYYSQKCKNKKLLCGQVATIITLVIGVIFLFVVLTWNTRKVTMKKTMVDNAVDGAALFMASQLGSIATRMAIDILGSATAEKCDYDWWLIATMAILVLTAPLQIMSGGTFTGALLTLVTIGSKVFTVASLFFARQAINIMWFEPNAYKNVTGYLKYLTLEQQVCEGAIAQVFFALVNDPKQVPDRHDWDEDGINGTNHADGSPDQIPSSLDFWYGRSQQVVSHGLGTIVDNFHSTLGYQYYAPPDVRNINGFLKLDFVGLKITDCWLPVINVAGEHEITHFTSWLHNDFNALLQLLTDSGYDVNLGYVSPPPGNTFWMPGYGPILLGPPDKYDDVDSLENDIQDFEVWAKSMLSMDSTQLTTGYKEWYGQLIDAGDGDDTWQYRMKIWVQVLDAMITRLNAIQADVKSCVNSCGNNEWVASTTDSTCGPAATCTDICNIWTDNWDLWRDICDVWTSPAMGPSATCAVPNAADGSICDSDPTVTCLTPDTNLFPSPTGYDANDIGVTADASPLVWDPTDPCDPADIEPDGVCDANDIPLTYHGCCGTWKTNCELCTDAYCPPGGGCCGTCCKVLNAPGDPDINSTIPPVVAQLTRTRNHIQSFLTYLDNSAAPLGLKQTVEASEVNVIADRTLYYRWKDSLGDHQVKITVEFWKDGAKVDHYSPPTVGIKRKNWGFKKCTYLKNSEGGVKVIASRHDKEIKATGLKGIIDLFRFDNTITSEAWAHYGVGKDKIGLGEQP